MVKHLLILLCISSAFGQSIDLVKQTKSSCVAGQVFYSGVNGQVACSSNITWTGNMFNMANGESSFVGGAMASQAGWGSISNGTSGSPIQLDAAGDYNGLFHQIYSDLGSSYSSGAVVNHHAYQEVKAGGATGGTARLYLGDLLVMGNTTYEPAPDHFNAVPAEFRLTAQKPGFYDTMALLLQVGGTRSGTVNTSGTAVTWVSGSKFYTLQAGAVITIGGTAYTISTVNSSTSLTLTGSAGTRTGASYVAPNVTNIVTGVENSVEVASGSAVRGLAVYSAQVDMQGTDLNTPYSSLYLGKSSSSANVGVQHGIQFFGEGAFPFPVATNGTLFRSRGGIVTHGVDFSEMSFNGKAFRSPGFSVDGSGNAVAETLTTGGVQRQTALAGTFALTNNLYYSGGWKAYAAGAGTNLSSQADGVVTLETSGAVAKDAAVTLITGWKVNPANAYILETNGVKLGANSEPACTSGTAGNLVRTAGGAGVADTIRICVKKSDNSYAYVSLVTVP